MAYVHNQADVVFVIRKVVSVSGTAVCRGPQVGGKQGSVAVYSEVSETEQPLHCRINNHHFKHHTSED